MTVGTHNEKLIEDLVRAGWPLADSTRLVSEPDLLGDGLHCHEWEPVEGVAHKSVCACGGQLFSPCSPDPDHCHEPGCTKAKRLRTERRKVAALRREAKKRLAAQGFPDFPIAWELGDWKPGDPPLTDHQRDFNRRLYPLCR